MRNLEHYFHDKHKDADFAFNLSAIARDGDVNEITGLIELVAAAAVTCENKSEYVSRIMSMTPESQVAMKSVLERSLARLSDFDNDESEAADENELVFDGDHHRTEEETPKSTLFANHLKSNVEEELAEAKRELASLKSQQSLQAEDHEKALNKLRAVVEDLQDRLVKRQDELIQVEEELQTARAEFDETKSKLHEALEAKAHLADDLEIANAKAQQLHKAEATVVAYKKKLETLGGVNQQMTDLEDQAANYLRQIMELESEVKKSNALERTVADLQTQMAKLEKEKAEALERNKAAHAEIDDLKSKLSAAERSKKMFEEELNELRARQETASLDISVPTPVNSAGPSKEEREKLMRLEIENQKLQEELEKLKISTPRSNAKVPETENVDELKTEIKRLQDELAAKEEQNTKIASEKDKLEAYTKRTLAKFQDKYLVALQECKAKLKEKQDKIEALENRSQSERTAQKREERLLSSTIYELGLAIMQNRLKER